MTIKENLTIINQWQDRSGYKVKGIVLHSMWGYYAGSIAWFKNPQARVSAHYCIKNDGEITLTVREDAAAWHSGNVTTSKDKAPGLIKENWGINPNFITIGIEMEDQRNSKWSYPKLQYLATTELVADICKRYKIKPSRDTIIMHKEIDPVNKFDPVGDWKHDKFVQDVNTILKGGGESNQLIAYETTVTVRGNISLNVRSGPSTLYPNSGSKIIHGGSRIDVVGFIEGEDVEGNNIWWKSKYGNYFWSGGIIEEPIVVNSDVKGNNMTQEELDIKTQEFEGRKAHLEAQQTELDALFDAYKKEYDEFVESQVAVEEPVEDEPVEAVTEEPQVAEEEEEAVEAEEVVEEDTEEEISEEEAEEVKKEISRLSETIEQLKTKFGL